MRPDEMWGTDATRFYTEREGWCWFFGAVDHYTTEVMGWHVAKIVDRWAALEPIRQGMTTAFGSIAPKVALGVGLRHDWGGQYTANTFVNEIKCWGFTDTPAVAGEPECNGCAERLMRTLKEHCLYLHQFRDLEEARTVIGAFIARYNTEWIVERLGYRTPAQARPRCAPGGRVKVSGSRVQRTGRGTPQAFMKALFGSRFVIRWTYLFGTVLVVGMGFGLWTSLAARCRSPKTWALATTGLLTERNQGRHDLLGGGERTDSNVSEKQQLLRDWWNVTDRSSLLAALRWIDEEGRRREFERMAHDVASLGPEEIG